MVYVLTKDIGSAKISWEYIFPDLTEHFGAPWQPFGIFRGCVVPGAEQVRPAPLDWYSTLQFKVVIG